MCLNKVLHENLSNMIDASVDPARDLSEHLASYGFKDFFSPAVYLHWARQQLDEPRAMRVDSLRKPLEKDEVKPNDVLRFYDFIADPAVAPVVHSMKTDAIRAGGEAIAQRLVQGKKLLDLGCNIGYLTTWYARQVDSVVTGVDISERSIEQAKQAAHDLNCSKVRFVAGDIRKLFHGERFDVIADTQTIYTIPKKRQVLGALHALLDAQGVLVTIPPLRTLDKLKTYMTLLAQTGFQARALDFIFFSSFGVVETYPLIEAVTTTGNPEIDVEAAFIAMRRELLDLKQST